MSNYVGRREQFIEHLAHKMKQNMWLKLWMRKMFFTQELREIIVCETNIYAEKCIQSGGITLPLRPRNIYRKPVTEDEINVVLALSLLMGTVQKPTLTPY
jgi:hypothetical protein